MDYLSLSVIVSSIGTISMIIIYIYLYSVYRERYMGLWSLSWLILLCRYLIFNTNFMPWQDSTFGLLAYELFIYINSITFLWANHNFINKSLNKMWLYVAISTFALNAILNTLTPSLLYILLLPVGFACAAGIWVGLLFIKYLNLNGFGRWITGYCYIIWSILGLFTIFILDGFYLLPWCYLLGGILRFAIALCTLMVYFEKTRMDLLDLETQYRLIKENKFDIINQEYLLPDRINMVGNMAITVAHEIRNPITTIRGYLQVLEKKDITKANTAKFKLMLEEIDTVNTIIQKYISLSREKVANLKICSLNTIIQDSMPLLQAHTTSLKIKVILDLQDLPDLSLDEKEIRQLLLNLVSNSVDAMPEGGKLTLRTFIKDDKVVLSINDQGFGIAPYILDKLGTPFITTKKTGAGLGIPLCYQIANRHHATINIDTSQTGTTFFICFKNLTTPPKS
ncbi:MAG: sasA 14 [Firmicutes bacterium]|nr:sasA 14 [Bacillota bacterium]